MSGIAEQVVVEPTRRRFRWTDGILIGLRAALVSTMVLLLAGVLGGRGFDVLADAGKALLPSVVHWATGASAALSYLLSHTLLYMLTGIVALALVGLPDRLPPLITGLVLATVVIEFGFLMLTTESHALGRVDAATWRALLNCPRRWRPGLRAGDRAGASERSPSLSPRIRVVSFEPRRHVAEPR